MFYARLQKSEKRCKGTKNLKSLCEVTKNLKSDARSETNKNLYVRLRKI